jgi:hypothetical protein
MNELDSLALKLATMHATDLIRGEALCVDGRPWFDASAAACEGDARAIEAVRFLELAGMLEHHPTNPDLVRTTSNPAKPAPLLYDIAA